MGKEIVNPLMEGDLEGAVYLCLGAAALTDLNRFPPGSGNLLRRMYHERKRRFEQARAMVKKGITNLLELGLSHKNCEWAARAYRAARDKEGWLSRFQTAESELRKVLQ